jgi:Citrate synthase
VAKDSLTITDNRTGKTYELPITEGTIKAPDLRNIKLDAEDFGLMTYDPAFLNTAACRSAITFIDGDRGILRYRGYPIEQIAEKASFLEVAYLLCEGELPTRAQLDKWEDDVRYHTYVHTNIIKFLEGFRYDAHPMGMLLGVVGALSTFYPDAKNIEDPASRYLQRVRLIAKLPTIAAFAFRHSRGLPYEFPRNDLGYIANFVNMTFSIGGRHEPIRCCKGRWRSCSFSTPTTSRIVRPARSAPSDPRTSIHSRPCPRASPLCTDRSTAAPTKRSWSCSTRSATGKTSRLHREGEAGKWSPDGFGHRVYKPTTRAPS